MTTMQHTARRRALEDLQPESRMSAATRRLRVAVFVSEFPALSETFVLRQIVGLIDRGHEVTVFADRPRAEPLTHPDFERYGLRDRTRYLGMPRNRVRRAIAAAGALFSRTDRRAMLARTVNPFRHGRDAVNLRMLYWVLRLADEAPFDVLHCHFGPVGEMVATLRDLGAVRGRLATTFHGADLTSYLKSDPDRYRRLARSGDLFLPISDYMAGRLRTLGCPADRIAVLRMGVDLGRFAERLREMPARGPLRLVTIGRLIDKKGVADALRAVAMARQNGINLAYTIIGDGPLREPLERLAGELGIADIVEFRGWQVHDAIIEALYEHHALLAPSITAPDGDQEGIPVTLMEAMATGMPVVSTRHSGIPELVENGVSGLLAEEGDHVALAAALEQLALEPALVRSMGAAARRQVAAGYDAEALDDELDLRLRELHARAA
ncbi:glycosyltransferase [Thalassobaculum sp.]|uniref:glycosyltransferase n=1 Tax=Thalassobaculum sp. TaxID=2022740 RepID=UPI0032EEFA23